MKKSPFTVETQGLRFEFNGFQQPSPIFSPFRVPGKAGTLKPWRFRIIETCPFIRISLFFEFAGMKPHGPWKIKSSQDIYADSFVHLQLDQVVRPDGLDGQHVVVGMKPGVCVLPIDADDSVVLTREFHYGIGRVSDEAVSGGIEPGEDPMRTAERELAEELGLRAAEWEYVTTVDPFTTIVVSPTRLYFARGLMEVAASPEGTEQIESVRMPLAAAKRAVLDGRITHAPTCVLILAATQPPR